MTPPSLKDFLKPTCTIGLRTALCGLLLAAAVPARTPAASPPAPARGAALAKPAQAQSVRPAAAADPGFYLEVHPRSVTIGEAVTLHLRAKDPNFQPDHIDQITFDPDEKQWHVEAQWRRDWQSKNDGKPSPWYATLRPFDTGTLTIPTTRVSYHADDGVTTETTVTTATLTVKSIRPADARQSALMPLREPAPVPRDLGWLWSVLLIVALCGLGGWLLLRWWDRRGTRAAAVPAVPELPPGLWALRELDQRSRLPVCQSGPAKPIFSHVSEVVRLYLGRRYGVQAIDMTTLECLHALHALHLDEEVLRWIKEFLEECDLIKFTTHEASRERWRTIWHDARLIVKMTTPESELAVHGAGEADVAREVAV